VFAAVRRRSGTFGNVFRVNNWLAERVVFTRGSIPHLIAGRRAKILVYPSRLVWWNGRAESKQVASEGRPVEWAALSMTWDDAKAAECRDVQ